MGLAGAAIFLAIKFTGFAKAVIFTAGAVMFVARAVT